MQRCHLESKYWLSSPRSGSRSLKCSRPRIQGRHWALSDQAFWEQSHKRVHQKMNCDKGHWIRNSEVPVSEETTRDPSTASRFPEVSEVPDVIFSHQKLSQIFPGSQLISFSPLGSAPTTTCPLTITHATSPTKTPPQKRSHLNPSNRLRCSNPATQRNTQNNP